MDFLTEQLSGGYDNPDPLGLSRRQQGEDGSRQDDDGNDTVEILDDDELQVCFSVEALLNTSFLRGLFLPVTAPHQ